MNIIEDYYTERKMVGDGSRYSDIFVVMNMKIFMIEDDYTERKMVGNESRYSDIFMVINMKIFMRPYLWKDGVKREIHVMIHMAVE